MLPKSKPELTHISICPINAEQTWPLRQKVMWPDKPLDYVKLNDDHNGVHFGLYRNITLIGVGSLFLSESTAQFRKLAICPKYQGSGLGTHLLTHIFCYALSKGVTQIWCNARRDKTSFYQRFDMRITDQTFTKGDIEYVIMEYISI